MPALSFPSRVGWRSRYRWYVAVLDSSRGFARAVCGESVHSVQEELLLGCVRLSVAAIKVDESGTKPTYIGKERSSSMSNETKPGNDVSSYSLTLAGRWEKQIEIEILDERYTIDEIVELIQNNDTSFNPLEMMPLRKSHWQGKVALGKRAVARFRITEVDGIFDEIESAYDPMDEKIAVTYELF